MDEGIRLFRQKRYAEALERFVLLDGDDEIRSELSYYLGLCYTHLLRYDEALLYLELVVGSDLGPVHAYQCRMIMGYIYARTERYRLAEFEFNRLLEDGYESAKVYAALAYAVYAQGKTAPAIAHLERALHLDPRNANALNSMGCILAESGIKIEMALQCCSRAVAVGPRNPAYLDSLALAQQRAGNLRTAKDLYEQAVRLSRGHPQIVDHYKELLRGAGVEI